MPSPVIRFKFLCVRWTHENIAMLFSDMTKS